MSKNKMPAYLALVLDLLTRAEALGVEIERDHGTVSSLPENRNFVFLRVDGGTAAVIIPMSPKSVAWMDSHIDWQGNDGYIAHKGGGGAVQCRIDPTEADLDVLLTALSGAKKSDRKAASKDASQAIAEFKAKLAQLGQKAETPSTTPGPVSDEAAQALATILDEVEGEFAES